jgi:hypothetical protein
MELARFDTQLKLDPEISGKGCQQGALHGYETRECLLAKWGRKCVYCVAEGLPLQIDRVKPKSGGGSDRVSNLTQPSWPATRKRAAWRYGSSWPGGRSWQSHTAKAKAPLLGSAAINSARPTLAEGLEGLGLSLETGRGGLSGLYGLTKFNLARLGIARILGWEKLPVLEIRCLGRGRYQRTKVNKYGFPIGCLTQGKVRAWVPGWGSGSRAEDQGEKPGESRWAGVCQEKRIF